MNDLSWLVIAFVCWFVCRFSNFGLQDLDPSQVTLLHALGGTCLFLGKFQSTLEYEPPQTSWYVKDNLLLNSTYSYSSASILHFSSMMILEIVL